MAQSRDRFEQLVEEALNQPLVGWDFSFTKGRRCTAPLPWDYRQLAKKHMAGAKSMSDMGTGGGEVLSSLQPLPPDTWATEAYVPNVSTAKSRLEPLGVRVVPIESDSRLPLPDAHFDLVLNRHEAFYSSELARILVPGGWFVTQQVGLRMAVEYNQRLQGFSPWRPDYLCACQGYLRAAGMEIVEQREAMLLDEVYDIGVVVFYLRAIPWIVKDFSVEKYRNQLMEIHEEIEATGKFTVTSHHYLVIARKPVNVPSGAALGSPHSQNR